MSKHQLEQCLYVQTEVKTRSRPMLFLFVCSVHRGAGALHCRPGEGQRAASSGGGPLPARGSGAAAATHVSDIGLHDHFVAPCMAFRKREHKQQQQ